MNPRLNPYYDFTGQVALVIGASSGTGLATAQAGAVVVLGDINAGALRAATQDLTGMGHQVLGISCDVSSEERITAMVASAVAPSAGCIWRSTIPASKSHPATPPTSQAKLSTG